MKRLFLSILYLASILSAFAIGNKTIEDALENYIVGKDARIGIAVIINGKDTVSVNGERDFPMMSVSKFPLAFYIMTGQNILIEKSKFEMASEDIAMMYRLIKES